MLSYCRAGLSRERPRTPASSTLVSRNAAQEEYEYVKRSKVSVRKWMATVPFLVDFQALSLYLSSDAGGDKQQNMGQEDNNTFLASHARESFWRPWCMSSVLVLPAFLQNQKRSSGD